VEERLSVLAFASMVAGVIGQFYAGALLSWSPVVIAIQACGALLMVWARVTFGKRSFHPAANPTAGGIVTTGPYRHLRHPIYTAILFVVWPPAIADRSILPIACAALITAGAMVRMLCEEHLLVRQYPDYADYSRVTKRMIPFVF
jgi:protein-S-isoprenylcysteine O-methyltransferase Ste14